MHALFMQCSHFCKQNHLECVNISETIKAQCNTNMNEREHDLWLANLAIKNTNI